MDITCENLCKSFSKKVVLESISFSTNSKVIAVVGENGAGKTTLLKLLATILRPDTGLLKIGGIDANRYPNVIRKMLGFCPEVPVLIDELTAAENVRLFASLKGIKLDAFDVLKEHGIPNLLVKKLSGGMRRRLSVAIALLSDPELIVMDEPTSELDDVSRTKLYDTLSNLKNLGKTIIFSTHRYEDLLIAEFVVALRNGRIIFQGPMDFLSRSDFYVVTAEESIEKRIEEESRVLLRFDNKITALIRKDELEKLLEETIIFNLRKPTLYELLKGQIISSKN